MYFTKTREINKELDDKGYFVLNFRVNQFVKLFSAKSQYILKSCGGLTLLPSCTSAQAIENAKKMNMNLVQDSSNENILHLEKINCHSLKLNGFISKGNDACVYNIESIDGCDAKDFYVVKIFDLRKSNASMKNPVHEKMKELSHKNIEKTLAYFICNFDLYSFVIVEKLDVQLCDMSNFSRHQLNFIAKQLINALDYLHRRGIVHCDIKENNIMYSKASNLFKLIDFNNASFSHEFGTFELNMTLNKKPMRLFKNGFDWSYYVDIWSLGATLYVVYFGNDVLTEYAGYTEYKNVKDKLKRQYIYNAHIIQFWEKRIKNFDSFFKAFFISNSIDELMSVIKFY